MSGHFGVFGGRFAPEPLMAALEQLTKEYEARAPTRTSAPSWMTFSRTTRAGPR